MIRHIVLFRLRHEVSEEHMHELMDGLRNLVSHIPEIRSLEVARDEMGGERSATFGLMTTFDDVAALERYREHPDHQQAAARVFAVSEWVKAWDYTIPS